MSGNSNKETLKIGAVGAGARLATGYVQFFGNFNPVAELVAVADVNESNIQRTLEMAGERAKGARIYNDWKEMLDKETELDGLIISTPNYQHRDQAIYAMEKGVPSIALEKPIATNQEDCYDIITTSKKRGTHILLGFVLRSAPFYQQMREMVRDGLIGDIITVQADELVSLRSSDNFRCPWRRYKKFSGGNLLEKCCHDMDILNWIIDARPERVNSYGIRAKFRSNPILPAECKDCHYQVECRYYRKRDANKNVRGTGECIFNSGSDVVDNQTVHIKYANGVMAQFIMSFGHDTKPGRFLKVIGTKGSLWGQINENMIYHLDESRGTINEHPLEIDVTGHYGGNKAHVVRFLQGILGVEDPTAPTAYDGYLSAMVCFAADRSMEECRQVGLHYDSTDKIELV